MFEQRRAEHDAEHAVDGDQRNRIRERPGSAGNRQMLADQLQLRSKPIKTRLRTIETPTEPRQPRRFEKNRNMPSAIASGLPLARHTGVQPGFTSQLPAGPFARNMRSCSPPKVRTCSATPRDSRRSRSIPASTGRTSGTTYERWAADVPDDFRFSVKMPKSLTHEQCLEDSGTALTQFLLEIKGLGRKLGCVLVQLPPGLAYEPRTVESFFAALRARHRGAGGVRAAASHVVYRRRRSPARGARRRPRRGRSVLRRRRRPALRLGAGRRTSGCTARR